MLGVSGGVPVVVGFSVGMVFDMVVLEVGVVAVAVVAVAEVAFDIVVLDPEVALLGDMVVAIAESELAVVLSVFGIAVLVSLEEDELPIENQHSVTNRTAKISLLSMSRGDTGKTVITISYRYRNNSFCII